MVTDDESFWEPVPRCWTVFRGDDGGWTYLYELSEPEPSPDLYRLSDRRSAGAG